MIELESHRWQEFAGRSADALVEALGQLTRAHDGAMVDELGRLLLPCGDVSVASYAVVPHLVALATRLPVGQQIAYWSLVGHVTAWGDEVEAPPDVRDDFQVALARAAPAILECLRARPGKREDALALLQSLAAVRGSRKIARNLAGLESEAEELQEIAGGCPSCGNPIALRAHQGLWFASCDEAEGAGSTAVESMSAVKPNGSLDIQDFAPERMATSLPQAAVLAGQLTVGAEIRMLFGRVECPACSNLFCVLEELDGDFEARAAKIATSSARELALVVRARKELAIRDPGAALRTLREHARDFSHGSLVEEADSLWIEAYANNGEMVEARARAARFQRVYPASAHGERVRLALERIHSRDARSD
jgi:hypothetical protein